MTIVFDFHLNILISTNILFFFSDILNGSKEDYDGELNYLKEWLANICHHIEVPSQYDRKFKNIR